MMIMHNFIVKMYQINPYGLSPILTSLVTINKKLKNKQN